MIEYKTAVFLAASLKIGAIIGGASSKDQQIICMILELILELLFN